MFWEAKIQNNIYAAFVFILFYCIPIYFILLYT